METKVQRQTNIELLKVIAMAFICISHIVNPVKMVTFNNDYIEIIIILFKNLGWMGDYIFITASCYFLAGYKKFAWRKAILYFLEIGLIFLAFLGVFTLLKINVPEDVKFKTLTFTFFFDYWYVYHYLIYLLTLPLLTFLLNKIPKKIHYILSLLMIPTFITFIVLYQLQRLHFSTCVVSFYAMHIIIDYGKKYGTYLFFKEEKKKTNIIVLCSVILFWIVSSFLAGYVWRDGISWVHRPEDLFAFLSPIWIFTGLLSFLIFKNIKVKESKAIIFISSLSMAFYVSHHNGYTSLVFHSPLTQLYFANLNWRISIIIGAALFRFVFGIIIATIVKLTIHPLLVKLTSIKIKKKKENEENTNTESA